MMVGQVCHWTTAGMFSMRVMSPTLRTNTGLQRQEVRAAVAETLGLFLIFIVSFTGRDAFGDGVKTLLIVLSVIVGSAGAAAGGVIVARGLAGQAGRIARLALGGLMLFMGVYSVVHVLS